MAAYEISEWSDFFVAATGASAALAGLVFVSVSINVERILSFPGLPERALETVLLLLSVVLISLIALVPGQSTTALGLEVLGVSSAFSCVIAVLLKKGMREGSESSPRLMTRIVPILTGTVPFLIGAFSLLATSGGGLYWLVAGTVFAIASAVANAWVLLVEILR